MRFRTRLVTAAVAAAAIAVPGGLLLATSPAAHAATPSCGSGCVEIKNRFLGNLFDLNTRGDGPGFQHQQLIFWPRSNNDQAEDFTISNQGSIASFVAAGLVSPAFGLHFGGLTGIEVAYTPDGVDSGLCVGTWAGQVPQPGFKLRLEPCGVGATTVWAVHPDPGNTLPYFNLLDAAGTNFSHPLALTWPSTLSFPFDLPRPWPQVRNLSHFSTGAVPDIQQFRLRFGIEV